MCPYTAIHTINYEGRIVSEVNEVLCKGCGTCVAACPSGVAEQNGFKYEQIIAEIEGILEFVSTN
jgi:heterodisulfide reductase subunit A